MRREMQVELIRRARSTIGRGESEMSSEPGHVPVQHYIDPDRLAREREVLFRRFPIVVGFSSQVARPGDFLTHDYTGVPILVVRDSEGELRAFLNVCRHRGAHLKREASGKGCEHLVCPFHGWAYDLKGRLQSIPDPAGFPGVDADQRSLVPVSVYERGGLVLAIPTPGLEVDIDQFFGSILTDLETFGFDQFMMVRPSVRTRQLNWKLHMDATHEIYHLASLHGTTAGSGYFNNISLFDCEPPHARVVLPQASVLELDDAQPDEWNIREHCGMLYSLFPNTCILVHAGYVQVLSPFPVDTDTTVLVGGMLVPKGPVSNEEAFERKFHYDTYWKTMEEDMLICESMQATMRSGANDELILGRYEQVVTQFHANVEDALTGSLTASKK